MTTTTEERDEMSNNIMAAGGIYMVMLKAGLEPEVVTTDDGQATNAMSISLHYMNSRYRVTVERMPDEEIPA